MKLIKLVLENLGPYVGHHEINFNDLTNSLFLISGQTGAGKSYIFDSICFALYGKTSGENREPENMKSKFANDEDLASVELVFESNSKEYTIKRYPKQFVYKIRTNTLKEETPEPVLSVGDEKITKTKQIAAKLKEVLHLDYTQFKMTMLIAQGDFYSLINAGTESRKKIFSEILNTEILGEFETKVEADYKDVKNRAASASMSIQSCRNRFKFSDELNQELSNPNVADAVAIEKISDALKTQKEELDKAKEGQQEFSTDVIAKAKALEASRNNNKNLTLYSTEKTNLENLLSLKAEMETLNQLLDKASKAKDSLSKYNAYDQDDKYYQELSNKLEGFKTKEIENEAKLNELSSKASDIDEKKNQVVLLDKKKDEINTSINEIDDYLKEKAKYESNNEKINNLCKENENLASEVKTKETRQNELKPIYEAESKDGEIATITADLNSINKKIDELDSSSRNIVKSYLSELNSYKNLLDKQETLKNNMDVASSNYTDYELAYRKSLVGIIASKLEDNKPCPVCGSIHHPAKASPAEGVSEAKLKELKSILDDETNLYNEVLRNIATKEASIKGKFENVVNILEDKDIKESNALSKLEAKINLLEESKKPLSLELNELNQFNSKRKEAQDENNNLSADIKKINSQMENNEREIQCYKNDNSRISGLLTAKKHLDGKDKSALTLQLTKVCADITALNKEISAYELNEKTLIQAKAAIKASIEQTTQGLKSSLERKNISFNAYEESLSQNGFTDITEVNKYIIPDYDFNSKKNILDQYRINLSVKQNVVDGYIKLGYDKLQYVDLTEAEAKQQQLENESKELLAKVSNLNSIYNQNVDTNKEYNDALSNSSLVLSELKDYEELINVIKGNVSGQKIDFETYYLQQIFNEIIIVASQKFNKMSNGRYELLHGSKLDDKGKYGLEIDVRDLYNGGQRPVSSLSGGESFQASMSLALAFAEIIQSMSGGIELNSMFIDEGFGTLDNEMLDCTKKTLLEISNSTDRRIGIISHIDELERSIPSKILVEKTDKGSKFKIVNDN